MRPATADGGGSKAGEVRDNDQRDHDEHDDHEGRHLAAHRNAKATRVAATRSRRSGTPPRGRRYAEALHDLELVGDPEEAVAVVHEEADLVGPDLQRPRAVPGEGCGPEQRGPLDQRVRVVVQEVVAVATGPRVAVLRVLRRSSPGRERRSASRSDTRVRPATARGSALRPRRPPSRSAGSAGSRPRRPRTGSGTARRRSRSRAVPRGHPATRSPSGT